MTGDAPETPRYRIVAGGNPTPEQLAAVVVALTPVGTAPAESPSGTPDRPAGWALAALHEGVGETFFASAPQVADARR